MHYPHLFSSLRLGGVSLKNRLVMSQMTMNYATAEGVVTEKLIRHYVARDGGAAAPGWRGRLGRGGPTAGRAFRGAGASGVQGDQGRGLRAAADDP
jgi:hypothetical protein